MSDDKPTPEKQTNETYEIEVTSPLLRPGLMLRTRVSGRYLVPVLRKVLDAVREFNS